MRTTLIALILFWLRCCPAALVGDVTFEIYELASARGSNWAIVESVVLQEIQTNVWRNIVTAVPADGSTNVFVTLSGVPEGLHTWRCFARSTNAVGPFSNLVSTNIHGPTNFLTVFVRSSRNSGPMTNRMTINVPPTPASFTSEVFSVALTNVVVK